MCLRRRTWARLRTFATGVLFFLVALLWVTGLAIGQSQDGINATLNEKMLNNAWRLGQVETRLEHLESKLDRVNWVLGVLSAQLFIKLLELWHRKTGGGAEHPPSIRERRSNDDDDD